MRNILLAAMLLAALGVALVPTRAGASGQIPRVGGFKPVATNNAEVVAAARFAVSAGAKREGLNIRLLAVESAEQQVVAGMIYRLCLRVEVEDTENNVDVTTHVKTEVFRSLQKQYQLRSWAEEDCAAEEEEN